MANALKTINKSVKTKSPKTKSKKMRHFYYIVQSDRDNRGGSGRNVKVKIVEATRDGMADRGYAHWNTAWYKGDESVVMNELQAKKFLPKNISDDNYYTWSMAEKKGFRISKL